MAMDEFVKALPGLGVGGAIAGLTLMFYRKDMREYISKWESQSHALIEVVKENTAAITSLIELVRHMNDTNNARRR